MVSVRSYGDTPFRVAVVHGGPGAPGSVAVVARELARDVGALEPLQTQTTLAGQIAELEGVLRQHAQPPVVLIGHSWGAWLAWLLTAQAPDLVKRLVLVGSGPFTMEYVSQINPNRFSRMTPAEQALYRDLLARLSDPATAGEPGLLDQLGELVEKADSYEPLTIATDERDRLAVDGSLYQSVWEEAAALRKSGELLRAAERITCPVLAIHGDVDPHPAAGVREPLTKALSDFRFVLLERCGHSPWKERHAADRFYELLRQELRA